MNENLAKRMIQNRLGEEDSRTVPGSFETGD